MGFVHKAWAASIVSILQEVPDICRFRDGTVCTSSAFIQLSNQSTIRLNPKPQTPKPLSPNPKTLNCKSVVMASPLVPRCADALETFLPSEPNLCGEVLEPGDSKTP